MMGVIMAGGRANRLRTGREKGLLKIGGRTLLERAARALEVDGIKERSVAVTDWTKETAQLADTLGLSTTRTMGRGYHEDVLELLDSLDKFVSLNVDVPFANRSHVERIIAVGREDSLAAVIPRSIALIEPDSESIVRHERLGELVWVGLNLVTPEPEISFVVYDDPLLSINVNTKEDLAFAEQVARERSI